MPPHPEGSMLGAVSWMLPGDLIILPSLPGWGREGMGGRKHLLKRDNFGHMHEKQIFFP